MAIIPLSEIKKQSGGIQSTTQPQASSGIIPLEKIVDDRYNQEQETAKKSPIYTNYNPFKSLNPLADIKAGYDLIKGSSRKVATKVIGENAVSAVENVGNKSKESALSPFRWIGKQLGKGVGVSAEEMEGVGNAIGTLLQPIVTKNIDMPTARKKAAQELLQAQKDAWSVLKGDTETSYSKKIAELPLHKNTKSKLERGIDTTFGIGMDLMLDPLNVIAPVKVLKYAGKVTGATKVAKTLSEVVAKTPLKTAIDYMFKTSMGDPEFMAIVNKFRNLKAYKEGQYLDQAVQLQKDLNQLTKTNPDIWKTVTNALEDDDAYKLITDPKTKEIVDGLKTTYSDALTAAKEAGLSVGEIKLYAPHIKTKESWVDNVKNQFGLGSKEFGKGDIEKGRKMITLNALDNPDLPPIVGKMGNVTKGMTQLSEKQKIAKNLSDPFTPYFKDKFGNVYEVSKSTVAETNKQYLIEKGVKLFEENPAIQLVRKGQMYAKAISAGEFAKAVKPFAVAEGGVKVTNPLFDGLSFLPEHARVIDNFYTGIKPDEIKIAIKAFDQVQNLWKANALVSPAYHIRNAAGNLWNNFLAGVNPFQYGKAAAIQKNIGGKYDDVIDEMKQVGVINEGWYAADIAEEMEKRVNAIGNPKAGLNPLSQQNYVFRANRAVGSVVENNARIAHYLHMKSLGKTAEEAAESVKKFLFDYTDLTKTEKTIFKRIAPFYTWTRKNLPLQLSQLVTQPAKFAVPHKIINAIENSVEKPNEKFMSHYLKSNVPVRIRKNDKGETEYFMLGQWLPYASAIDFLSDPIENSIGMLTTALKVPAERYFNTSAFFKDTLGRPAKTDPDDIEEYWTPITGQKYLNKKNVNLLRNIRVLNDINNWIDSNDPTKTGNSWQVKLMNQFFGKAATYNVQKSKYFYDKDTNARIIKLKDNIEKAQKSGYTEDAARLRKELIEFQQKRRAQ